MVNCNCLIHPFQNDPGTSQRQRVMDELLSGAVKIDARTLADLLDFFVQMSGHINYYDSGMRVGNWQPFFQKSIPFTLATMIRYRPEEIESKFSFYQSLFDKRPGPTGLQLIIRFVYFHFIHRINSWHLTLKDSQLPVEFNLELLIRDKLQQPVKDFIGHVNAAVASYGIKRIDFLKLSENRIWNISQNDLYYTHPSHKSQKNKHRKIHEYNQVFKNFVPEFSSIIRSLTSEAEKNLELSLIHKKEELQQRHEPHLALVFTFLHLFRHLQDDLNQYSRKHLDFFYKDILQLEAAPAVPDKAHVLFEIQAQLKKYLLKKGLLLKGGKDEKKQEILFSLEDELVANKTEIVEKRMIFLNNQAAGTKTYVEGVYMAPDLTKANGVDKDFQTENRNFPTLGRKESKYTDAETKNIVNYPNARLGFLLSSPVLYLQGGTRKITMRFACRLNASICSDIGREIVDTNTNCCHENGDEGAVQPFYPGFLDAGELYASIKAAIGKKFIYINESLFLQAVKTGFKKELIEQIRDQFLVEENFVEPCYCKEKKYKTEHSVLWDDWDAYVDPLVTDPVQKGLLDEIFTPLRVLKVGFSGEKDWIIPAADDYTISMGVLDADRNFLLTIETTLGPDQPAISYFDKKALKENIDVVDPVVRVELDDRIKLRHVITLQQNGKEGGCCEQDPSCCLLRPDPERIRLISFYHFFRDVELLKETRNGDETRIRVEVCGLNKFIVQNDEGLQDVKSPVYPFGPRPDIIDYNVVNPSRTYYVTQQLIDDATPLTAAATKNHLQGLIAGKPRHYIGITDKDLDDFLLTLPVAADRPKIKNLLQDPSKNYGNQNLVGPNFYLGSEEVFCKNWEQVWININWKEKPNSFNDYYKAYVLREEAGKKIYGLDEDQFQINLAVLDDGSWRLEQNPGNANARVVLNTRTNHFNRELFKDDRLDGVANNCLPLNPVQQVIEVDARFFNHDKAFSSCRGLTQYTADSKNGFFRITLENQDFLHKEYAFVLARQMMALGRLPDVALEGAIYVEHPSNNIISFKGSILLLNQIANDLVAIEGLSDTARNEVQAIINALNSGRDPLGPDFATINAAELADIVNAIDNIIASNSAIQLETDIDGLLVKVNALQTIFSFFDINGKVLKPLEVPIPNEPYTPVIKDIFLDYVASAGINEMDLIHLYPFAGTWKQETISLEPALFPTFCDEGNLFLGLKGLEPGNHLQILFQLAEATADSETQKEEVKWYYLGNNNWRPLRKGFEVLDDATENLTSSGIIKLALPQNMTDDNSVMPATLFWIRAAIPGNSKGVSETTGIHPQAVQVVFTNGASNDQSRLSKPLPAGSIARLQEADAAVKTISQPYASFGGSLPEGEGQFYVRVSERLRHKGRAIQAWDYERLVLEAFPQLYKAKCINHSFALDANVYKNDFPYAPGYVVLALIPDLFKLKAGNSLEPRVPVSILEKIETFIRNRTSPFVRIKAMNPRYEKIRFCIRVQLQKGRDENYYREQLKQDLSAFLAPWAVGEYHKLSFGQCVSRADIIRFLETRDYVDFITDLRMSKEGQIPEQDVQRLCPDTPRSILIAGDIEVCIEKPVCEKWGRYQTCEGEWVSTCANKPEPVVDYCKQPKINWKHGR